MALFTLLFLFSFAQADEGVELIRTAYVPELNIIKTESEKKSRKCRQTRIWASTPDPLNMDGTREIEFVKYTPRKSIRTNVIMMPPTGGVSLVDRQVAGRLCKEGIQVLLNYSFTDDMESSLDPQIHERAFIRGITAIKHMALSFEGDFGLIGTSLGSLYSSQALVVEPRITKALLVVGGAPIADILTHSEQDGLKELRETRMSNLDLKSKREYLDYINDNFRLDLLSRLEVPHKPKLWVIRSLKDDTVPASSQTQLIALLQPTRVTDSKAGHVKTIFNLLFKKGKIADFFLN